MIQRTLHTSAVLCGLTLAACSGGVSLGGFADSGTPATNGVDGGPSPTPGVDSGLGADSSTSPIDASVDTGADIDAPPGLGDSGSDSNASPGSGDAAPDDGGGGPTVNLPAECANPGPFNPPTDIASQVVGTWINCSGIIFGVGLDGGAMSPTPANQVGVIFRADGTFQLLQALDDGGVTPIETNASQGTWWSNSAAVAYPEIIASPDTTVQGSSAGLAISITFSPDGTEMQTGNSGGGGNVLARQPGSATDGGSGPTYNGNNVPPTLVSDGSVSDAPAPADSGSSDSAVAPTLDAG